METSRKAEEFQRQVPPAIGRSIDRRDVAAAAVEAQRHSLGDQTFVKEVLSEIRVIRPTHQRALFLSVLGQ
jgi:hypothetical protein